MAFLQILKFDSFPDSRLDMHEVQQQHALLTILSYYTLNNILLNCKPSNCQVSRIKDVQANQNK